MYDEYVLNPSTYEWTVRSFHRLKKLLGINIKLHGDTALLDQGEIFLFNHFARTETFLPHYVIHQETGAFCRCIATKAIFSGSKAFRNYLCQVGVIPNDYEGLFPLLVAEIIRGRKVIIYPEGGMVKDRRVLDDRGRFSIYSSKAGAYRKHHSGAAVLAIALDTFKLAVQAAEREGDWQRIDDWVEMLELNNREHLLFAAHRPTRVVPGNITFYPIHTEENFLNRAVDMIRDDVRPSVREELLIEANLLLKDTDMDLRLGQPVCLSECRPWWERWLLSSVASNLRLIEDFFTFRRLHKPLVEKIIRVCIKRSSEKIRDQYMESIYLGVTVNLSHIASTVLLNLYRRGLCEIKMSRFCMIVYMTVKKIQKQSEVHLHRSIRNPEVYSGLTKGDSESLEHLLDVAVKNDLVQIDNDKLLISGKLGEDFDFETIRLRNTLQVYANEVAPLGSVLLAVNEAIKATEDFSVQELANLKYDDELKRYDWNHHYYSKARFNEINRTESIVESGRPFFYLPEQAHDEVRQGIGILLVHGFLSSPAEMRPMAEKLLAQGYPVYGVRMAGHGTSPADLRERSWHDWLHSLQRGYEILSSRVDRICMLGFSTGGAVSLLHAADQPDGLLATVVINPPIKFRNKNMKFVPILHGVSKIVRWSSPLEGVVPYRSNEPEHPRINYRNVPVRGLYELMQMKNILLDRLREVTCPCLLVQSSNDPITTADSTDIIMNGLVNAEVSLIEIDSDRHGILYEDTDNIHEKIIDYVNNRVHPAAGDKQAGTGSRRWAG